MIFTNAAILIFLGSVFDFSFIDIVLGTSAHCFYQYFRLRNRYFVRFASTIILITGVGSALFFALSGKESLRLSAGVFALSVLLTRKKFHPWLAFFLVVLGCETGSTLKDGLGLVLILVCGVFERFTRGKARELKFHGKTFFKVTASLVVLATIVAAVFFPLLPRVKKAPGLSGSKAGYTENIELENLSSLKGQGSGEIAVHFELPDGSSVRDVFPQNLVRVRTFDIFDGKNWIASPARFSETSERDGGIRAIKVYAQRGKMPSDFIPIPYSALDVKLLDFSVPLGITEAGEWKMKSGYLRSERIPFEITVDPKLHNMVSSSEMPRRAHTKFPKAGASIRLKRLVERLKLQERRLNSRDPTNAKVRIVLQYLSNGFHPIGSSLPEDVKDAPIPEKMKDLSPIDQFLFVNRKGHCEIFATSAAVLLRLLGVPTRLISGFRITREVDGNVLAVKSGDGHAWLEYYSERSQKWHAIDPTPVILRNAGFLDYLKSLYESAEFWFERNIAAFGAEEFFRIMEVFWRAETLLLFAVLILVFAWRKIRQKNRDRWRSYREELLRAERQFGPSRPLLAWRRTYEKARFGPFDHLSLRRLRLYKKAAMRKLLHLRAV